MLRSIPNAICFFGKLLQNQAPVAWVAVDQVSTKKVGVEKAVRIKCGVGWFHEDATDFLTLHTHRIRIGSPQSEPERPGGGAEVIELPAQFGPCRARDMTVVSDGRRRTKLVQGTIEFGYDPLGQSVGAT